MFFAVIRKNSYAFSGFVRLRLLTDSIVNSAFLSAWLGAITIFVIGMPSGFISALLLISAKLKLFFLAGAAALLLPLVLPPLLLCCCGAEYVNSADVSFILPLVSFAAITIVFAPAAAVIVAFVQLCRLMFEPAFKLCQHLSSIALS